MKWVSLLILALLPTGEGLHAQTLYQAELNRYYVNPPTPSPGVGTVDFLRFYCQDNCDSACFCLSGGAYNLIGHPQAIFLTRGEPGQGAEPIVSFRFYSVQGRDFMLRDTLLVLEPRDYDDLYDLRLFVVATTDSYPDGEIAGIVNEVGDPVRITTWGRVRALFR
jgi:hypothetical protein